VTAIGQLKQGERVKVSGEVVLDRALVAPLVGKRCAYWCAEVRSHNNNRSEEAGVHWEAVPFWLQDATGRVWVDPDIERFTLRSEVVARSGTLDEPSPDERALLDRMNVLATDLLGLYRKLSYRMEVLEEGEQVAVLGTVAWVEVQGQPTLALVAGEEGLTVSDAKEVYH
jgi:hypothetical protein